MRWYACNLPINTSASASTKAVCWCAGGRFLSDHMIDEAEKSMKHFRRATVDQLGYRPYPAPLATSSEPLKLEQQKTAIDFYRTVGHGILYSGLAGGKTDLGIIT